MTQVYLLLGSNEGIPEQHLAGAVLLIQQRCGTLLKRSLLYETEAWGVKEQNSFLNQALLLETLLSPTELLATLKTIEKELGRIETVKWGPRVIDIDILFYGNELIDTPELKIPHPYVQYRRFTLAPMNEIASEYIHPVFGKTMKELLRICEDDSEVKIKIQQAF